MSVSVPSRRSVHALLRAGGLAAVLALPLIGCGSAVTGSAASAPAASTEPAPATTADTAEPDTAEPDTTDAGPTSTAPPTRDPGPGSGVDPTFGRAYVWLDGMTVAVGSPSPFVPSDTASADPASAYLAFDVLVRNDSRGPYDDILSLSLDSDGVEADRVFDSAQGIEGTPSDVLAPGGTAMFTVVYGVADPTDLAMKVRPGFDYEPITFTGN